MNDNKLKILCCPKCQFDLQIRAEFLFCKRCFKEYLVKDNIPVLLQ